MRKPRAALVTAFSVAVLGTGAATVLGAGSAYAASTPLGGQESKPVASGSYTVQNDEWGSAAPEGITTDGNAGFKVANSSINLPSDGAPGAYPSIYAGCHWGSCTEGGLAAHPVPATTLTNSRAVTTNWDTTQPGSGAYDVAYDIWFNQAPTTKTQPNGAELMVWLNHRGGVHPFGHQVGTATIHGVPYQVWEGPQSWGDTISYVMAKPGTSVSNLDIGPLAADAIKRGYIQNSWYLIDVEAGFEIWQGGAGLATNSFSVNLHGGTAKATPAPSSATPTPAPSSATPTPAPSSATPTPAPSGGKPTPAPSPASAFSISRQAISPSPTAPGTATNATVGFKYTGSAPARGVTFAAKVLNSAGTVVGSQSWTGQNVAPQQELSETYSWAAAKPAGTYTIKALVRDSAGKVLQQAQVGTVTVKPSP